MYLGLNAYSHDSSACLMDEEGNIVAAVEEERFTQKKHYSGFPEHAIKYCFKKAGITSKDLKGVAVGWNTKELFFDRIIKEYLFQYHPPFYIFKKSIKKLWRLRAIANLFEKRIGELPAGVKIKFYVHHQAHAASAFYASGFNDAAFLTIDARGEYDASLWGQIDYENGIQQKGSLYHPNSIGCVWGAVGEYCGFEPGWQKAGTTMAFAALGKPKYLNEFRKIVKFSPEKDSDWLSVDTNYFKIADCKGEPSERFEKLIGGPSAKLGQYKQAHYDVAATWQEYTQEIILGKLNDIHTKTKKDKLVMAGGVCLNSVTNGFILEKTPFKEFYIQPASHDAGVAIGAAYLLHQEFNKGKTPAQLNHTYLGPDYSSEEIENILKKHGNSFDFSKEESIHKKVARLLSEREVVMWFQGRLEFGPRALGARSILASAVDKNMIDELNKIKHRESFRPFAISILEEKTKEWLVRGTKSPYMLLVDAIKPEFKNKVPAAQHVDGSVRVQTVNGKDNGIYYNLLKEYTNITNIPLFINTSFNIKGLPIVNDPEQAVTAFLESRDIKYLAIGTFLVFKK
ncbi:MAG: carbamoyltransferase C-terminal domain-containing protein [bacterium]|nr:carbamoyltransferase C-terminal domain-containing protein [bacterium]